MVVPSCRNVVLVQIKQLALDNCVGLVLVAKQSSIALALELQCLAA